MIQQGVKQLALLIKLKEKRPEGSREKVLGKSMLEVIPFL